MKNDITFLLINIPQSYKFKNFETKLVDDIIFRYCYRKELKKIYEMYKSSTGIKLSRPKRLLFYLYHKKLILIAEKEGLVIGFAFFYTNPFDIKNKTIHLGHYFVNEEFRGKGIGKKLLKFALESFCKNNKIKGISLRVSLNNVSSLKAIMNFNFLVLEKYYDSQLKEERYFGVIKCQ
jgi:GNAT superfamily N-acetyltransferase